MGKRPFYLNLSALNILFFLVLIKHTSQNVRNKRQLQPELPRILTENGHLVFQTGTTRNITFKSVGGGYININGDNLAVITQTVWNNKLAIDQLRIAPSAQTQLRNIQNRLNNLQPTGAVQSQLVNLSHRIDLIQARIPDNIGVRLSQLESGLNNVPSISQVTQHVTQLTTRLNTIEGRIMTLESASNLGELQDRVNHLEATVARLQALLTTNECASNPCRNGGQCVDTYNGFFCRCSPSFQGIYCDEDVNECAVYIGTDMGCQNGATCVNTLGSFTCTCTANWYGIRCTESHDDCTGASAAELCGHGTCVNQPRIQPGQPKYTCICEDGWTISAPNPACVVDVNECASNRPPCSTDPLVSCINQPGSFMCGSCPAGYLGNGFVCNDINECAVNNGGCFQNVQCINTQGSRSCGPCPAGFQGNGVTCTWVGLCQINNGGCHQQAVCTESPGFQSRTCTCIQGYMGNGVGINGCMLQSPTTGPCASRPCMNGARCENVSTANYHCICQPGYTDQNCATNINECQSNPCHNGATCSDRVNGYVCQCTSSFTGINCEIEQQTCGGHLTGESGSFHYPMVSGSQYPHNASCLWVITTIPGKILMLIFLTFQIEDHFECSYDSLQIHDGPALFSRRIGKYCGYVLPNNGMPINSSSHQLLLWFQSDSSASRDGFNVNWTSAQPVCGGNLFDRDYGNFQSPGYPGNYPANRDCIWTIMVSPGKLIMFTFAIIAIERHPNCSYDYLEIRDGGQDTSPQLRRYCNTTLPPPLTTTGPSAWVKFHSDANYADQGFHILYAAVSAEAGCGGTYTTSTGSLTSPNYPSAYSSNIQCVWTIRLNVTEHITFTFTDMLLQGHINCQHDFVELRDGSNENAPLMGRYCGDSVPVPMTTTGNMLYVKFVSDSSVTRTGFRATWAVTCGGIYSQPSGMILSPNYPRSYPSNQQCEYFINQPPNNRITLAFQVFNVQGSSSCQNDFLEVHDGGNRNSPLLGKYCGNQFPNPQITNSNSMYLIFVTDGSAENLGFLANYTVSETGCGGLLTGISGSFQSPGHPNKYPHGVNCTWNIQVQPGFIVQLTFHAFNIEYHDRCNFDSVSVYDNSSAIASSHLGRYCGTSLPPVKTSTNNVMTILFQSDHSINHEGFMASYVALNASTMCGRDYSEPTGVITSPNYPTGYPRQRACTYTITAPAGNQIMINVTDFRMEQNCMYDYVEIRNGGYATSPLVGIYCGTNIDRIITSHSNRMYIKLVTDNSQSAPGFKLTYTSMATGCGAYLNTPTGSFVSPNYPMPYGHNAECFWKITVAGGSTIQFGFIDLDLEFHDNCNYDYVEVHEKNSHGALLGKFCGNTVPEMIRSQTNSLWVKFRTDYSMTGRGFHAYYNSICLNTLTDFSGLIESPNFPNSYPNNRNCTWLINVAMGNNVSMSFSHFDIASSSNCTKDYLMINNGALLTSPPLGRFCGVDIPLAIESTGENVWVRFVSDSSVSRTGFRLEYATNGCGGYLRTPTGSFTSPNYPNPYPHRRQCEWTITADTSSYIQLTIETFDLESHSNCNFDVLEVYGGADISAPRLTQLCHTQKKPQMLTSSGNVMFVHFKSDSSVSGTGFSATYKTMTGGCGGNFSTPSGSIVSRNYPSNYPVNTECTWLITVTEQRTVQLTFTDFDVEMTFNCSSDYVVLYDGSDNTAPELMRHCGNSLPVPAKYQSNGNQMYIRMRTDSSISARGFKADYVTGCGGTINGAMDGELVSPNYPRDYPYNTNCSWVIVSNNLDDRITLTFTHMDLENSNNCNKDYLLVLDGNDIQAPQIGKFCGSFSPTALKSQGSSLFVQFVSDHFIHGSGFRATYTKATSACGGDFISQSGSFTSPGFPNSYPINTECVWTIRVAPGNRVQLAFSEFNLEEQRYCNNDYLEMHEGQLGGPLIGRFCGNNIPSNLTAYNGLWIKFRSDNFSTGLGFMAQYAASYGGDITGTSGQLASPMYPSQYPHNANYNWRITVAVGMRISITFTVLDMEAALSGCTFDYLKVRNGGTVDSPLLGSYCGTLVPVAPVVSTTNQLYIEFHSDWSSAGSGFLFHWQETSDMPMTTPAPTSSIPPVPGCGGVINVTEVAQTLTSPGYPSGYLPHLNCMWTLYAPPGSRVWMNITDIDTEEHHSCNFDTLQIYKSVLIQHNNVLGKFCGRVGNSSPLVSTANMAAVKFTSDGNLNGTGFAIQYKAVCGGDIQSNVGTIKSPNYPGNYAAASNCSWNITVPVGRTIQVTFNTTFSIQGTPGTCAGDYLQLLNGGSPSSPPLGNITRGRYCGNTAPATMTTSSNLLRALFVSDNSGSAAGFSFTFTEVYLACGGQLTLNAMVSSGIFMSPNYPNNYQPNIDCVWIIISPANERIQIDFLEDFNIETHSNCNYDFIELRDGGTVNSPSVGKFCGTSKPNTVVSTGNVMYARFRTDGSVPKKGFKAQYKIATCGGSYSGSHGTITSPNYPDNYKNNANCTWIITAPVGHYLTLTFTQFTLPAAYNCSTVDYVEIREINSTGPVLLRACGSTIPSPVLTSDSYAYILFLSDAMGQSPGFSLSFTASVEVCGGDLTTQTGSFQSPNFPGNYPHSRNCEWRINVQQGRKITFMFNQFNIEYQAQCFHDYVAIYNGILRDSPLIGRYCGNNVTSVQVSGNTAKVVFRTDGSLTNGGFQAFYSSDNEADCGGMIISSPGNITSPGYGSRNYTNNLECIWTLQNQNYFNTSIVIKINDIKLEPASTCHYDFLEVREGDSSSGDPLDKYCGNNTIHEPIISPFQSISLRFKSDSSIVDQGFHLSYYFTMCGGILSDPMGVLTSTNYPYNYSRNDACAWKIKAPEGSKIVITFTDFAMEAHPYCAYDYVEIFNGPYASSPSIGKFCGTNAPPIFISQSNAVRIVLFTDNEQDARGFRMTYAFTSEGCGGLYHSVTGNLSTPNYPRSYPHNTECVWNINVQSGYTVMLQFLPPFDMQHDEDCSLDYVEVSDVQINESLVPLGRWCQNILPPVVTSTGHQIVVKFRSDDSTNGNGFAARWTSGCGGLITPRGASLFDGGNMGYNYYGVLTSPGFPKSYSNNLRCNYTIVMNPQHYIELTFNSNNFDIESGNRCKYDFVALYAGNSSSGQMLGKFCGSVAPQPLSALGQMYIQFWTDGSIVRRGFRAEYRVNPCGGVFTSSSGTISTPNTFSSYHNNHNCTWNITVQPNMVIGLKFTSLDLEVHSSCDYDYLDIYDGNSFTSPLIGRYCGDVIPTDLIRSTSNTMFVNLITDASVTRSGFRAEYYSTYGPAQGCGGILNSTSGQLQSVDTNGDGQYENDLNCHWMIIGGDNKVIKFTIQQMDIEYFQSCSYDYLKLYDGISMQDPVIQTYCGNSTPAVITSTTNVLYVQFVTDSIITRSGFNASFTQLDALCGGTFISSSIPQTVASPGYPNAFNQDVKCRWTIDAPNTTDHIEVNVTAIDLRNALDCRLEYLELRDYPLGTQGRAIHICGATPPPTFNTYGQTVQINYVATVGASTGFSLTFKTASCNRVYTASSGQIYSPGWPGVYPKNISCSFSIQAPVNTTVSIYFNRFHIEPHENCSFDYLEVLSNSSQSTLASHQLCGWILPDPIFTATNNVWMTFMSDNSVSHAGYDISYTATTQGIGCGGTMTGINGSFTSPGYPGNYTIASTCTWLVQVPARRVISLTFLDMQLQEEEDCETDYVILYNGNNDLANEVARYCGLEIPSTFTTSANVAFVKYVSDGVGNSIKFRLIYRS